MPTGSLNGSSKPRRSSHHNHVVLGRSLTGHLALGVHLEACIQHGIRDLIADLIRVASELRREASGIFGDLRCSKKKPVTPLSPGPSFTDSEEKRKVRVVRAFF